LKLKETLARDAVYRLPDSGLGATIAPIFDIVESGAYKALSIYADTVVVLTINYAD
jgi:hypothetical protein